MYCGLVVKLSLAISRLSEVNNLMERLIFDLLATNLLEVLIFEELVSSAVSALGVRLRKLSKALNGQSWDG
jgi:hypothetical protein